MIKEADVPKAELVDGVGVFFEVAMKVFVVDASDLVGQRLRLESLIYGLDRDQMMEMRSASCP
jgi:hypothetical protein